MRKNKICFMTALVLLICMLFTGCPDVASDDPIVETISVESVVLDKKSATLVKGNTLQLKATITPTNATDKNIAWTTSDSKIVTVVDGLVTAIDVGTAEITVTTDDGNKSAKCSITVEAATEITGISFTSESETIETDASIILNPTLTPVTANGEIIWTSSDETVAKVNSEGIVNGLIVGTSTITAKSKNNETILDTITINVVAARESYLFKAEDGTATADIAVEIQPWAGEINTVSVDDYTNVLTSDYNSWGACVAFQFASSSLVSYRNLVFDAKVENDTSLIVKIPEATVTVNLSTDAISLGNDWYHVVLSIPDNFSSVYKTATQIGIFNQTDGVTDSVIYLTNVKLTGENGETDDSALVSLIAEYQELLDNAVVGSGNGEYPQDAYDAFSSAISSAENATKTTQTDILDLIATLNTEAETFNATRVSLFNSFAADPTVDGLYLFNSSGVKTNNVTVTNWNPGWGQLGSLVDESLTINEETRTLKKIQNLNYQGIEFNSVDASSVNAVHISYFTENGTSLDLYPIIGGEYQIAHTVTEKNKWVDHVYYLDTSKDHSNTYQFKFVGAGDYYIDNFYFFLDTSVLSTEIEKVETLLSSSEEGTSIGQYAVDSKDVLQAALTTAKNSSLSSASELSLALNTLKEAEAVFANGRVNEWSVVPQAGAGAWFKVLFTWTDDNYALTESSFDVTTVYCDNNACSGFMGGASISESVLTLPLSMVGADFNVAGNHTLKMNVVCGTQTYTVEVLYTNASEAEGTDYSVISTTITKI